MATNTTVVAARVAKPKAQRPGRGARRSAGCVKNKLAVVGLILVILLLFCGIFGPFLAPWPYQVQDLPGGLRQRQPAAAAAVAEPHPRDRPARA